ncbi:hypothetical protein [Longimicrobium terrae]|uniref:Uncharacterized protein n=1 Tax=Longimicrobium terrae TaxID=1639882 RepID=A0A841GUC3_9BACT|nr:hypothetical protein [Longimicrobium terrae]MBB4635943.1 hypothetical protein [Longimicrobium terrae]MBB6070339.1 hypothetical protein [Longimicrobium terrae]NNC30838.1 hypothetical protein [Longimicrobium terrae]
MNNGRTRSGTVRIIAMVLAVVVVGIGAACVFRMWVRDPRNPNTAFTSAVLDRYSPGSRFGKPIDWLGAGEELVTLDRQSLGFAVKTVANPGDGISEVNVWAPRARDGGPTDSLVADRFAFSVDLPKERSEPPFQVTAAVESLFGARPEPRCASGREEAPTYRVYVWENGSGGGVIFSMQTDGRSPPLQSPEAGLVVYPAGVSAQDALEPLRVRPCPGQ